MFRGENQHAVKPFVPPFAGCPTTDTTPVLVSSDPDRPYRKGNPFGEEFEEWMRNRPAEEPSPKLSDEEFCEMLGIPFE
ncbi:MAG: hypothetical protein HY795_16440 [Desulfovibrio sp.]|nr:hypothetical protein [Desulfovibrio sp.]